MASTIALVVESRFRNVTTRSRSRRRFERKRWVQGLTSHDGSSGIYGLDTSPSGGWGVDGASDLGTSLYAVVLNPNNANPAIEGDNSNGTGAGVVGQVSNPANASPAVEGTTTGSGDGVYGSSSGGNGVYGTINADGSGLLGGYKAEVIGDVAHTDGVIGLSQTVNGVFGLSSTVNGVLGQSVGTSGIAGRLGWLVTRTPTPVLLECRATPPVSSDLERQRWRSGHLQPCRLLWCLRSQQCCRRLGCLCSQF